MMQEARVAESNMAESQRKALLCHLKLFCSQPLQKARASNGTFRIPSGGTATCAKSELAQLFDGGLDLSGTMGCASFVCQSYSYVASSGGWSEVIGL